MKIFVLVISLLFSNTVFSKKFKVGVPYYPPYEYFENGSPKGLFVDLIKEAFKRMGHEIEFQSYPWARILKLLKDKKLDFTPAYKNEDRQKYLVYSKEFLFDQKILVFSRIDMDNEGLLRASDFYEKKIALVRKISYGSDIDDAISKGKFSSIIYSKSLYLNFKQLLAKRVDYVFYNQYGGRYILKKNKVDKYIKELPIEIASAASYLAFAMKPELIPVKKEFDKVMLEMVRDGSYKKIVDSHMSKVYQVHK